MKLSRTQLTAGAVLMAGAVVLSGVVPASASPVDGAFELGQGSASAAVQWRTSFDGGGRDIDAADAVAADGLGHVFAGGLSVAGTGTQDFTVVKADVDTGALLWRQALPGAGTGPGVTANHVDDIAVDRRGDPLAVGVLSTAAGGPDFAVVKFNGRTGSPLWQVSLRGNAPGQQDEAKAVVVDANGDVYAGGYVFDSGSFEVFTVVKIDGHTGRVVWRRALRGTGQLYNTQVNALSLDLSGNLVAAGSVVDSVQGEQFTVAKFDARNGKALWRRDLTGHAARPNNLQDEAYAVSIDHDGNVVAAGMVVNDGTQADLFVVKLAGSTGTELWRRSLDSGSRSTDLAHAVAVDDAGDVVVAGVSTGTGPNRFLVVKLAGATGSVRWRTSLPGGEARSVLVVVGNVVAAGDLGNDLAVETFDGTAGTRVRDSRIDGPSHGFDYAFDVTAADGGLIAGGSVQRPGTSADFTLARLTI